jgi:hypothetical protein
MAGAQFGIGSQATYPLQQTPWGLSAYGSQVTGPYQSGVSLQPILQSLQIVTQQIQQLQQLHYVQQQQLQQLQQWIQVVPQQIQQLQQQQPFLAQQSPFGATGLPSLTLPAAQQFFPAQPGHVM